MSKKNKSATHNTVTNPSSDIPLAIKICMESYLAFQVEVTSVVWDCRSTYWRERIQTECKQYLKAARTLLPTADLYPLYKQINHDETPHQVDAYYDMLMAAFDEAKTRENK